MRERMRRVWHNAFWESVELFVSCTTLLVGVPTAIDPDKFAPPAIQGLNPVLLQIWACFILVGGAAWMQGILLANLYTRKAGLALVTGAAVALGGVLLSSGEWYRIFGSVTYFLAGVALGARFVALAKLGDALSLATRLNKILKQGEDDES